MSDPSRSAQTPPRSDPRLVPLAWDELARREWDVIVAGGGPAGAAAAAILAGEGGLATLIVDREAFPRDKVCGDGLIPDAQHCLRELGLAERVRRAAQIVPRVTLYGPSRHRVDLDGEYWTMPRERLDAEVLGGAIERGARLAHADVIAVREGATSGVEVDLRPPPGSMAHEGVRTLRARSAILATGADIALPLRAGFVARRQPSALALRTYIESDVELDALLVSFDRAILPGYAWIFPVGDGRFNVGVGAPTREGASTANLREIFAQFVSAFPLAREIDARATRRTPLRGAPLRCGLTGSRQAGPRGVLAVGEAIGTTFDLTGEGIGKAMQTGILGARRMIEALRATRLELLETFPRELESQLRRYYVGYEHAARWMAKPWVCDLVFWRASRSRFLRESAAGILAETVDARRMFSLYGLVRSFIS